MMINMKNAGFMNIFHKKSNKVHNITKTTTTTTPSEEQQKSLYKPFQSSASLRVSSTTSSILKPMVERQELMQQVQLHEEHAKQAFDLVASNSCCSPSVRNIMGSALMNSYSIGLPGNRFYGGCQEIDVIETKTRQLVCEVFKAKHCEVQFISGMMANIAAYHAMLPKKGLTVMASPAKNGGHYSHNEGGPLTKLFGAKVVPTPWDPSTYNVDLSALSKAMQQHKPTIIILGWSEMLFEHDLPAIRKICNEHGCKILYDMSHVAGLVAGGIFQQDMMEYADIVTSSTGKSLHSADHGLVLYNDPKWTPLIREAVMPLLTSNTHFQETAALYMTMMEMQAYGRAYATQVVKNTKALARELTARKFPLLCAKLGSSETHELILDLNGRDAVQATKLLDACNIFTNPQELPMEKIAGKSTGLRLGTQVLTRRGYKESDMAAVAEAMHRALQGPRKVLSKTNHVPSVVKFVAGKSSQFSQVDYVFPSDHQMNQQ